MKILLTRPFLL
ncbi:hypothetical protein Ahy_B07g086168 isoform B [Arachis hypogaea]|uniref:Uncharacterized protein n=1 Tax=Arachis hypogaea TaxID=3818 RepID=A0A444Y975_ARAHY|nr:hypothetical protein Ahy_B07g086168 isoform B [Arachis hypogaea]